MTRTHGQHRQFALAATFAAVILPAAARGASVPAAEPALPPIPEELAVATIKDAARSLGWGDVDVKAMPHAYIHMAMIQTGTMEWQQRFDKRTLQVFWSRDLMVLRGGSGEAVRAALGRCGSDERSTTFHGMKGCIWKGGEAVAWSLEQQGRVVLALRVSEMRCLTSAVTVQACTEDPQGGTRLAEALHQAAERKGLYVFAVNRVRSTPPTTLAAPPTTVATPPTTVATLPRAVETAGPEAQAPPRTSPWLGEALPAPTPAATPRSEPPLRRVPTVEPTTPATTTDAEPAGEPPREADEPGGTAAPTPGETAAATVGTGLIAAVGAWLLSRIGGAAGGLPSVPEGVIGSQASNDLGAVAGEIARGDARLSARRAAIEARQREIEALEEEVRRDEERLGADPVAIAMQDAFHEGHKQLYAQGCRVVNPGYDQMLPVHGVIDALAAVRYYGAEGAEGVEFAVSVVTGTPEAADATNPVRCQEAGELGVADTKQRLRGILGEAADDAIVDLVKVDVQRKSTIGGELLSAVDWACPRNHVATRVILPDGRRYVLDYWEAMRGGQRQMIPEAEWRKRWRERLGEDMVCNGSASAADLQVVGRWPDARLKLSARSAGASRLTVIVGTGSLAVEKAFGYVPVEVTGKVTAPPRLEGEWQMDATVDASNEASSGQGQSGRARFRQGHLEFLGHDEDGKEAWLDLGSYAAHVEGGRLKVLVTWFNQLTHDRQTWNFDLVPGPGGFSGTYSAESSIGSQETEMSGRVSFKR